ncbi:three-helix bundle dimerization domain-containing protein [Actinophytocola sp.]|jgi:hypothetical protein|uniref:three-helix bundle dimerization domain-containing protein n=1 Tax=Actinophytocola sp. TaxID=1872138 RepID=UPI002ED779A7
MTTTLDSLARDDLDRQLATVKSKLATEYDAPRVDDVVDEERERFADAPIRSFLPILIERSARARLGRAAPG